VNKSQHDDEAEPWFRNPWVWLVIAIPALTVVGGFLTLYLALAHPHILVTDDVPLAPTAAGTPATGDE